MVSARVKDAERRLFGDVFRCDEHGGHCYTRGGAQHYPYLGWTCGGCYRSSGTEGEPLMFSDHRCGIGTSLGAVGLPVLLSVLAVLAVSWWLAR